MIRTVLMGIIFYNANYHSVSKKAALSILGLYFVDCNVFVLLSVFNVTHIRKEILGTSHEATPGESPDSQLLTYCLVLFLLLFWAF